MIRAPSARVSFEHIAAFALRSRLGYASGSIDTAGDGYLDFVGVAASVKRW